MVEYVCEVDEVQYEIDRQQKRCGEVRVAYSKGDASASAVNKEDRKLADLTQKKWRISAGLASDAR